MKTLGEEVQALLQTQMTLLVVYSKDYRETQLAEDFEG